MAKINRYTQVQPASFTPLSMEEIFRPAMMQRESHDAALDKMIELDTLDSNRLAQDDPMVSGAYEQMREKVSNTSQQLASTGFDGQIKNDLTNLRREYAKAMSPTGAIGRAEKNYQMANMEWSAFRDAQIKRGASPDFIQKTKDIFMNENYKGVINEDGTYNEFVAGRTPNYYDVPNEVRSYLERVGVTAKQIGDANIRFMEGPHGTQIMVTTKPGVEMDNFENLQNAIAGLNAELLNTDTDKGYSAALQGLTPEILENMLYNYGEAAKQSKIDPLTISGHPIYDQGKQGGRGSGYTAPIPKTPRVEKSKNIPANTQAGRGRSAERAGSYIVADFASTELGQNAKKIEGPFTYQGDMYLTAPEGGELDLNEAPKQFGSSKGVTLQDAKDMGYIQGYTIRDVVPIKEEAMPKDRGSIASLNKDRKLRDKIVEISAANPVNQGRGSMLSVGGKDKDVTMFPNIKDPKNFSPSVDSEGNKFFIYSEDGAELKVLLDSELYRVVDGVKPGIDDVNNPDLDEIRRAYIPVRRSEALKAAGEDANVSAPIELYTSNEAGGFADVTVTKNQPFVNPNSVARLIDNQDELVELMHINKSLVEGGYTGIEGTDKVINTFQRLGVNMNTILQDWEEISGAYTNTDGENEMTILQFLNRTLQTNENAGIPDERTRTNVGGTMRINDRGREALDNFIRFLSALELTGYTDAE